MAVRFGAWRQLKSERVIARMHTWLPLNSPSDLKNLEKLIPFEYAPAVVAQRLQDSMSAAVKAVLVERNYVDKDYRSTFYQFYAKKGQRYRPDCVRLHFFDGLVSFDEKTLRLNVADNRPSDHYFGYMVLRPT